MNSKTYVQLLSAMMVATMLYLTVRDPAWFAYPGVELIELETGEWIVEKKQ